MSASAKSNRDKPSLNNFAIQNSTLVNINIEDKVLIIFIKEKKLMFSFFLLKHFMTLGRVVSHTTNNQATRKLFPFSFPLVICYLKRNLVVLFSQELVNVAKNPQSHVIASNQAGSRARGVTQ